MVKKICVTGAGGFIGSHLVDYLKRRGYWVRGVDLKYPEWGWPGEKPDEFETIDLRLFENCLLAVHNCHEVYNLAADMGGIGYIHSAHAQIAYNNSLISNYMLEASRRMGVKRFLFSSSACVYPLTLQTGVDVTPLKENDAYPALPEDAYGWEKLVTERTCAHYFEDYGLITRVARFHNIYGPFGTYRGGKEKAPAALCRKVAMAVRGGASSIEIWGDGQQTRSFCYVDDCVHLLHELMKSDYISPINIGTDRLVTIDGLAHIIMEIAGVDLNIVHVPGTQGVRGRNADLTLMHKHLGFADTPLEVGLTRTYYWIEECSRIE